jgi:exo-beta-1,3-glucanase (GH17 family)
MYQESENRVAREAAKQEGGVRAGSGRNWRIRNRTLALLGALAIAASIAVGNFVVWDRSHPTIFAPAFYGQIAGLAYNAFGRWDTPLEQKYPHYDSIKRDMGVLARHTTRIRTYSSNELPLLPALAEEKQLYVTAGVWLDSREDNNEKEIRALEEAVRSNSSIERVIVANEQILHRGFTPAELILKIREVKRRARKPVSTAEPWHVWLRYPELASNVDFITVHLLPYWEGLPVNEALDYAFDRLRQVEERFPNKKIVIGEVGWPSQGDRRMGSYASPAHQAQFIREFLVRAQARNLDYFLMEAVDQPWKIDNEGRAGPYWGSWARTACPSSTCRARLKRMRAGAPRPHCRRRSACLPCSGS